MSKQLPDWDIAASVRKAVAPPKKRLPPAPPPADESDEQRTRRRVLADFQRAAAKRKLRALHDALPKNEKVVEAARLLSWATKFPGRVRAATSKSVSGALLHAPEGWPDGVDKEEAVRDFIAERYPRPEGIAKTEDEDTWFPGGGDE